MKSNATKTETTAEQNSRRKLQQVSRQLEIALISDKTPQGVKDCLITIIIQAATETSATIVDINDPVGLSRALPGIIEKLDFEYGCGVYHSIHAIIQYNTDAVEEFHKQRLDQDTKADDESDIEVDDTPEVPTTAASFPATLAEHTLGTMANKISHVLASGKVSGEAKDAFQSIIIEAGDEANQSLAAPELIKTSLPLIINNLDADYGRGIMHALEALRDSGLVDSLEGELTQYEKRFDGRTEDGLKVLDLSNSSIEDLAITLSGIMHNPNLPKQILECLEDNLNGIYEDIHSPANILANLK